MKQHLHVQAHRGASLEAYENTVESISQAVELGAHSVECDIHLLKDHHCVVPAPKRFNTRHKMIEDCLAGWALNVFYIILEFAI